MSHEFEGALTGGLTGASLGSFGGPIGAAVGFGVGAIAGGFGLFGGGKRKRRNFDVTAELNKISAAFSQAREQARAAIREEAGQIRGQASANLAARGVLRSPVSQNTFGALNQARLRAVGASEAAFGVQEAQTRSRLFGSLAGLQFQQNQLDDQRRAGRFGLLGNLATTLLLLNFRGRGGGGGGGGSGGGGGGSSA